MFVMKFLLFCLLVVCLTADAAVNVCFNSTNGVLYFSTDCTKDTNVAVTSNSKPITFATSGRTGAVPTAPYINASQLSGQLNLSQVSIPASNLFGSIAASRIAQNGSLSTRVLPQIPITRLPANLQSIPLGFNGSFASLSQRPTFFSRDYNGLTNKPEF